MKALETLFGNYALDLNKALDRATHRNSLLARNLANVNTVGYKRTDSKLDIKLTEDGSFAGMLDDQGEEDVTDPGSLRLDGNNVDLERESFAIAETELRYQMLSDLTNKHFSGLKSVIREGR